MKIAVITPFYKGEKYMESYASCIKNNINALHGTFHEIVPILINDSPEVDLVALSKSGSLSELDVQIITNEKNRGIHFSRVQGLNLAKKIEAKYVIFLDQDDILRDDAIKTFIKYAENPYDIIIANANLEQRGWSSLWIRTPHHASVVWDKRTYITIGTQIISPGQCMIKTSSIPDEWSKHILEKNGADDYYLWLLMLSKSAKHRFIHEPLYTHIFTGTNLSANTDITDDSTYSFIPYLLEDRVLTLRECMTLSKMLLYKSGFRKGNVIKKAFLCASHPGLFAENIAFKLRTKTSYGFNRE